MTRPGLFDFIKCKVLKNIHSLICVSLLLKYENSWIILHNFLKCITVWKNMEKVSEFFLNKEHANGRKQSVKKEGMKGIYFYSTRSPFKVLIYRKNIKLIFIVLFCFSPNLK